MKEKNSSLNLIKRIPKSLSARKKTYQTSAWAWFKGLRKNWRGLGRPVFYIWIMGCQRSGTTLLERIFRNDLDSSVFGEFSQLTIAPDRTVWKPLPEVEKILAACNARYAVARPLFESDRASEILDFFKQSTAVWVFRDYRQVINSMISKWKNSFFEISRSTEADSHGKWRLGDLHDSLEKEAELLTGKSNRIEDLYALYWLRRNEAALDKGLQHNNRILFLNYAQLVTTPKQCIDIIVKRCGGTGVWKRFSCDANPANLNRRLTITISPEIQNRCDSLFMKLCLLSRRDFPVN